MPVASSAPAISATSTILAAAPGGTALVRARSPEGEFLALVRVDSLRVGGKAFHLVGGIRVDRPFLAGLAGGRDVAVSLTGAGPAPLSSDAQVEALLTAASVASPEPRDATSPLPSRDYIVRSVPIAFIPAGAGSGMEPVAAGLIVSHPLETLRDLLGGLDRWLILVLAGTSVGALVLAIWLAARISRPLDVLAQKTARIDLDHLDADFSSTRTDEVGTLSRFLAAMVRRLQASLLELRDAERRATLGELARQVNHDLRNGISPIRNVLRHLGQVARNEPSHLTPVFLERQSTIESSLAYLEDLAANYARLSPDLKREPLDLNDIIRQIAPSTRTGDPLRVDVQLAEPLPRVAADPVALRRVIENLVRNARESLGAGTGTVTLSTRAVPGRNAADAVVLTVADTGAGMSPDQLGRIFDRFYTTKEGGSGLGLAIVKRLVSDFDGTIDVESTEGRGTRFTITLPSHGGGTGHSIS
jgi:signal transduction histidine kinase